MDFKKLYINGQWVDSASGQFIDVENPATMKVFARVPAGNAEDLDKAARAAHAAFPGWAATPLSERIALMKKMLARFKELEPEIIDLEVKELGSPVTFTKTAHCEYQYVRTQSYIDLAPQVKWVEKFAASTVYREPLGVIACVTPWNYPLGQIIQKVIPAILMGNTVIVKPSQHTPLTSYLLTDAFDKAGFPKGVFNLVIGRGAEIGDPMAAHPLIDMIDFTGSTKGGVDVAKKGLDSVKRLCLELGGKSPDVFLKSDDYTEGLKICFNSIFLNAGQTCTALSRLLIPREDKEKIEAQMKEMVKAYAAGDPTDPKVLVGPVASKAQYRKISEYIQKGIDEGATILAGGMPAPADHGYYIQPTIFTDVKNTMSIARDEIFGPVLCVIPYDTVDEAVEIANDTRYGLNAAVWGPKEEAIAVGRRIQAGNVYINDGPRDVTAPFGGYKESGIGREGGLYGLLELTQLKALFDTGKM